VSFPIVLGLVGLALTHPGTPAYAKKTAPVNVLPQLTTTVAPAADLSSLIATSSLGGHTAQQPIGLSTSPNAVDPTCPILNLQLAPINLNLLGLDVSTSAICLSITAQRGGGLLGDLLCGLSNALNLGVPLSDFLRSLTAAELTTLLDGLSGLINGALNAVTTTGPLGTPGASTPSVIGTTPGACDILHLSLGPVDLTLLGLNVHLDDCNNGPVIVDITAIPAGGLLGQLLCSLDNLLNGPANAQAIIAVLTNIAKEIAALL